MSLDTAQELELLQTEYATLKTERDLLRAQYENLERRQELLHERFDRMESDLVFSRREAAHGAEAQRIIRLLYSTLGAPRDLPVAEFVEWLRRHLSVEAFEMDRAAARALNTVRAAQAQHRLLAADGDDP